MKLAVESKMPCDENYTMPMLEVHQLTKIYGKTTEPALENVSFSIEKGEFVVVLGRSGSGKTTLFRCINRLIQPTTGDIVVDQQRLSQASGELLRKTRLKIATIFQQFNLVQRLSVLENVLSGRLPYIPLWRIVARQFTVEEKRWALHCLYRVGMLDQANQRADSLSGGQQQRVAIARALAQQPAIILADEPIASLDTESAAIVLDELQKIVREYNIMILCSLHQEEFAMRYATRIIGVRWGKLVVDVPRERFDVHERSRIYE